MGKLQEILATLLPDAWAASLESESRAWRMRCPCGAETSIWDMGGIRWMAAGSPRRIGRCGQCGRDFVGALYRNEPVVDHNTLIPPTALNLNQLPVAETIAGPETPPMRARQADRGG